MCFTPQLRAHFRHLDNSWKSKSGPSMWCFNIFTSKCASRHNGMHFFHISTSKSGPIMVCLATFRFKTRFAPRTTVCNFSSLIWPATSAPAALARSCICPICAVKCAAATVIANNSVSFEVENCP